jgi:hypothetical protein
MYYLLAFILGMIGGIGLTVAVVYALSVYMDSWD